MNRIKGLEHKKYENNGFARFPFILLSLFLIFLFTNNHVALFIADYFILLFCFVLISFIIIMNKDQFKIDFLNISIVFLFLILLIGSVSHLSEIDRGTILSYIAWFCTILVIPSIKPDKKSLNILLHSFIIGSLICSIIVIFFGVEYLGTGRYTIKFLNNDAVDPNYLGCFLYLGFAFCLLFLIKNRKTKKRGILIVYFFAIMPIIWAIFLTGSRAAYICSALAVIGFFIELIKWAKPTYKLILLVSFIIIPIILFAILQKLLPDNIFARFELSSLNDTSNQNRLEHWYYGFKAFALNPFGYGALHTKTILSNYVGHVSDAHSTYITFMLQFGFLGIVILIYMFYRLFKPFFKSKSPFWVIFIFSFLINGMIIANHLGVPFWMTIIILYYLNDKDFIEYVLFK